jgi:thiamine biosynthesis lipoprotein
MTQQVARAFRAMNTNVKATVCVHDDARLIGEQALSQVQCLFDDVEKTLSRFRADSELSLMNAAAGHPFKASPLLFEVVGAALDAARATGGVFDPTILRSLLVAGYDRSFEKVSPGDNHPSPPLPATKCTWQDVYLDEAASTILIPADCGLDLGGIGKGWTVDRACRDLQAFSGYVVNAGGDIRVGGTDAQGKPWTIGVTDPYLEGHDLAVVELCEGAVCTSTTTRRKWQLSGSPGHHLIDPRSGKPAESGVVSATVIADSAARAEVLAKVALILGPEAGIELIEGQPEDNGPRVAFVLDPEAGIQVINSQPGVQGLLVLAGGQVIRTSGFKEVLSAA